MAKLPAGNYNEVYDGSRRTQQGSALKAKVLRGGRIVSNDDLMKGLPPVGSNPLDGDLLEDMGQPAGGAALTAGGSLIVDEGVALTSPSSAPADETVADASADEPKVKSPGFVAKLAQSNPYTVILFASLVALLIGILCLLLEWGSYSFEIKPTQAGQLSPAAVPLDAVALRSLSV